MKHYFTFLLLFLTASLFSQNEDSLFLNRVATEALTSKQVLNQLKFLCDSTPNRLLGSAESLKAVQFLKSELEKLHPDTCYLQAYETKTWQHISTQLKVIAGKNVIPLHALALGPSVPTGKDGIQAGIVEVSDMREIQALGRENIQGKIVFINQRMPDTYLNPFYAYREVIKTRLHGASEAARYGAAATVIRSLTQRIDTFPHTGKTIYVDTIARIPIVALATQDADELHELLQKDRDLKLELKVLTRVHEEQVSYNVIADIKGSEKPAEFILFGAHSDSWYNTQGAHDDGVGCVQGLEVVRILKKLSYKNKHTIRIVFFMDEELSQTGADNYAELTRKYNWKLIAAIESDASGLTPANMAIDASGSVFAKINSYLPFFKPYGLVSFYKGPTDVDIERLKQFGVPLIGNKPANQRYFDYHHSGYDSFDKVNFREMQLNTSNITNLIYLIDKYEL